MADAVQFLFSSSCEYNESRAAISLVTRSFLRARQVIFLSSFFFVHRAKIAGALALPQLIFRRVETRLSIGRRQGRPFSWREHRPSFKRN